MMVHFNLLARWDSILAGIPFLGNVYGPICRIHMACVSLRYV